MFLYNNNQIDLNHNLFKVVIHDEFGFEITNPSPELVNKAIQARVEELLENKTISLIEELETSKESLSENEPGFEVKKRGRPKSN